MIDSTTLERLRQHLTDHCVTLVHVVAMDCKRCIGKDNALAWHIPEDLQHFKKITTGGVVLMGRKTFESIGKALPNRINWVITHNPHWQAMDVKVASSLEAGIVSAVADAKNNGLSKVFIIGGAQIYHQTLALSDRLEISRVGLDIQGDAFYPMIDDKFYLIHQDKRISAQGVSLSFESYVRKDD